ncbi:MAG: branched-chain alpha-keto acid dehydrogenase subunit E2 [Gammaproteobacteria bacterium]|nr:branched-chain alpha-keto acid dehydrogenase subunit E2 [Gammaproteobacteria bacterium]
MTDKEIRVPDLGSFKDVTVIEMLVQVGDRLEVDVPLATLETEKATMDVPAPVAGVVKSLHIERGGQVNTGDLVAIVELADAAATSSAALADTADAPAKATPPVAAVASTPAPAPTAPAPAVPVPSAAAKSAPTPSGSAPMGANPVAHAGPSVRRLARELGVDLAAVQGTGIKGRITHEDVKSWVKRALQGGIAAAGFGAGLPKVPSVDHAAFGPVEVAPLNRVQKISGPRLHASWVNLPHVTQFDEADITPLEDLRKSLATQAQSRGVKLTPLAFIIAACARALVEFPTFNASLDDSGQNLILKKYVNLGFAADTPNGLLVPVIKDILRKDIFDIAGELGELAAQARGGKLPGAAMQGGCFTVSSLGGIGGTAFTPIINAPEVAILGVSRSSIRPVYVDGAFVPRLILPLSLSYDHRVIDGALGVRFTTWLASQLSSPVELVAAYRGES